MYAQSDDSFELSQALSRLLPSGVRLAAATVIPETDAFGLLREHGLRFPEEAALVAKAVPKRVREFLTARNLARELLGSMGVDAICLRSGPMREPLWPDGIVGSITHSDGLVMVAIAETHHYRALGLDVEPNRPLPPDVTDQVSLPGENDEAPASRAVFVVKEAFYKAHCVVHHRMLDFTDVRVQWNRDRWTATELVPPQEVIGPTTLEGFIVVTAGWLAAFCAIEA